MPDQDKAASPVHELTHRSRTDGRLVPACVCGWWSADGSHIAFERHLATQENTDSAVPS